MKVKKKPIKKTKKNFLMEFILDNKKLSFIVSLLAIISMAFAALLFLESRYAKSDYVVQLERRLDYKITNDLYWGIQDRIWKIMDRCPTSDKIPTDPTAKEELRVLFEKRDSLKRKLEVLEKFGVHEDK